MNKLTQFLIKEMLDEPKTVAIYGGGFKPPTKGHFNVAKQTLEDFPEIDELKIFVGGGVRDGITQDESIKIWEIYKKYLSSKVDIEPSVAPVKSILGYAKENPDTKVYWILGAREGDEDDLKDIESRTKSISKYPNLEVKVITSKGGVSGTKTRAAIKAGNKELFSNLIPDVNEEEKEQIWNLVIPVIKEVGEASLKPYKWEEVDSDDYSIYVHFVTDSETQYDVDIKLTTYVPPGQMDSVPALEIEFLAKPKDAQGSSAKVIVNKGELYRVMATITDIIKKYLKKSRAEAIIYSPSKKSSEESFGTQRDNLYRAFISKAIPGVTFKKSGDDVTAILPSVKEATNPQAGTALPYGSGFAPVKEAKQEVKDSMVVVLSRNGNQINLYDLETNEALGVINTYGNEVSGVAAKKGYGPLMYELGMANVYPNGLQSDRRGNTEPAAENIWRKYMVGTSPNIRVQKLTPKDKDYRTTYDGEGYDSSYIPDFYNYKFYNPDTATLKQLIQKGNTLSDELKKQIVLDSDKLYSNMVHESNSKDPFGLKEFIKEVFKKDWNLKEGMLSLTKYMMDNGMNITPLPKIKVIKDDKENASHLLGKTAYYNPTDKSITLYTLGRHPKDVLRSFSHEMVHHMQNLEGRLNNINTTNTNEDGDLPEIEREAYEKGNMMLRNWEDSIKNV